MKNKTVKIIRWGVLAVSLVWVTIVAVLHQKLGGGVSPSIHALCPFGGLESLYTFFATGTFVSKIFIGTMILFGITLLLAIVFRRSFCGLLCPFGALQEFFAMLGKKLFGRHLNIPKWLDRPLRYLKYIALIVTVFYAWKTAGLWVAPYDPWSAYAHLSEGLANVWKESAIGLILLIVTVVGSMLYNRFFCKYLCPMGALYGLVGKLSPYKVVRNADKCVSCGLCSKNCPVNIDVQHLDAVKSAECISCQSCVLSCPKAGALELHHGKKTANPALVLSLALALFIVPVAVSKSTGVFDVLPSKPVAGQSISFAEVKGYMSIEEAAKLMKLELPEFYKQFKIPENVPKETKMKEISTLVPEYDFDKAKESLK